MGMPNLPLLFSGALVLLAISDADLQSKFGAGQRLVPADFQQPALKTNTAYLYATAQNTCQQIPEVLLSNSVYCHGPYPVPTWDIYTPCREHVCDSEWKGGSCQEHGFSVMLSQSINVTDQEDMYTCVFTEWDYDTYLPPDLSKTWWDR